MSYFRLLAVRSADAPCVSVVAASPSPLAECFSSAEELVASLTVDDAPRGAEKRRGIPRRFSARDRAAVVRSVYPGGVEADDCLSQLVSDRG